MMPLQITQPPVLTEDGVTTTPPIAVPDQFATVRTNAITGRLDYPRVVGTKYEPAQNEESCTLLDALTEDSSADRSCATPLALQPSLDSWLIDSSKQAGHIQCANPAI